MGKRREDAAAKRYRVPPPKVSQRAQELLPDNLTQGLYCVHGKTLGTCSSCKAGRLQGTRTGY